VEVEEVEIVPGTPLELEEQVEVEQEEIGLHQANWNFWNN
jgi:hypothetical protein